MPERELPRVLFGVLVVLAVALAAALAAGDYVHKTEVHLSSPARYVTIVMEKKAPVSAVFEDENIYGGIRALQKQKIERNRNVVPLIEEKERQKEEYIKRRKNWVRYIDGRIITGYDERYDSWPD